MFNEKLTPQTTMTNEQAEIYLQLEYKMGLLLGMSNLSKAEINDGPMLL